MCNCSLASEPCDSNALCGISTSFPVLFHTHRQVAHALLTRPPLIRDRSPFTVRLECVMHAASVHPEPGSNSLIIVYFLRLPSANIALRVIQFAQLLFRVFLFLQKNFRVPSLCAKLISQFRRCSIFKDPSLPSPEVSLTSISLLAPFVNTFF